MVLIVNDDASMLVTTLVLSVLLTSWLYGSTKKRKHPGTVPHVKGGWPILGHAIEYGTDTKNFVVQCQKEYGSIFQVQVLSNTFVILDERCYKEYFKMADTSLSFDHAVLYILKILAPDFNRDVILNPWHTPMLRRRMSPRNHLGSYLSLIETQVRQVLKRYLKDINVRVFDSMKSLAWDLIASCSASVFMGEELCKSEGVIDVFTNFHAACFRAIELANMLPSALLWMTSKHVEKHRDVVKAVLIPVVEKRRLLLRMEVNCPPTC